MSEFNPCITKVLKIERHPDANSLEIAYVWDYPVCTKIGQYQVGQLVGHLSLDTVVPDTEEFHFLCPKAYEKYEEDGEIKQRQIGPKYPVGSVPEKYRRIKAKQMVGVYSQGMLIDCPDGMVEGDSLVERLGLYKFFEEEEDDIPAVKKMRGLNQASPPKGWSIPFYDIEPLRKFLSCIKEDEEVVYTEKLHGCSASFCFDGEKLWAKSRRYYQKFDTDNLWWDIAIRNDLENKLKQYPNMVFFGEIVGQVKGFKYDAVISNGQLLSTIHFFDIFNTSTKRYLDYEDRVAVIKSLGLSPVPELYKGIWQGKDHMYELAEGMSTLNPKTIREGLVVVPLKERFEPKLHSRLQLKLISKGYNLQK